MTRMRGVALLVMALALGVAAGPPPEAQRVVPGSRSGFTDDGGTGCWIWIGGLPRGATEVRAKWSGECPEGPAEGEGRSVMSWREDGRERGMLFEGRLVRGKAEGRGVLTHLDNGEVTVRETGEYRNDHFVQGRIEFLRNGLVYEGGWSVSGPQGPGRLELRGQVFEGTWEGGCLKGKEGWISFTRPAEECDTAT